MQKRKGQIQKSLVSIILFSLILFACGVSLTNAQITAAGTEIFNQAKGDYFDHIGNRFSTVSPRVSFIIRAVPRLTVSPDDTEPTAVVTANERIVRAFRVCNSGNIADTYSITQAQVSSPSTISTIYFDTDSNGIISSGDVPVSINQTASPRIEIGACFNFLVEVLTNDITVGNQLSIDLTVQSNTSSDVSDPGKIINIVGNSAILTSPIDPNLPPLKLVNQQLTYVGAIGERLNYSISFKNRGDVSALNVAMIDDLPSELRYVANSMRLDNRNLTDSQDADEGNINSQRIEVRLPQVTSNQVVTINFQAVATGNVPTGSGILNTADLSANNANRVSTNPAIVIVNPFGVVYSGNGGASVPISNARITVFSDRQAENLAIFPINGFEPNSTNENPFNSNQQGRYSFSLGGEKRTVTPKYFFNITAENYRPRLLEVTVQPSINGLFNLRIGALDGMPIAVRTGFELTTTDVSIENIAALAFNIPMFSRSNLEITKAADRAQAEIGENVNYRVEIHNSGTEVVQNVVVIDTLPFSFSYISGTGRIIRNRQETAIEPQMSGESMIFNIGELGIGERVSITYRVRIGVNARQGDQYNLAIAKGNLSNGEPLTTQPAKAGIKINAGAFSMRQIIIGRVYADANQNNLFDKGEKGIANVRLYLANGASVITDSEGLYSFPAITEGSQVIEIDPLTIPENHFISTTNVEKNKLWTRLLRTPIGGGGMLRQNFALVENTPTSFESDLKLVKSNIVKELDKKTVVKISAETPEKPTLSIKSGEIRIENIADKQVIKNPAMNVDVSVFTNWKVLVQLNGQQISDSNIGTTREDHINNVTTFTFIGLGLKAGPNFLRVKGINSQGELTNVKEITVYGSGNAKRIEILTEKKELQASGRDRTKVKIMAFDEWNNPAQDATISVQTTIGSLVKIKAENSAANPNQEKTNDELFDEKSAKLNNQLVQQATINLSNGTAEIELISGNQIGEAELKAVLGNVEAIEKLRVIAELRPTILVGLAEFSIGKNAPEMTLQNSNEKTRGHLQFFYRGKPFGTKNLLTLSYNSQQPLNRVAGQDRLFQLSPLERTYAILGDSSTRFQESESNSKVYARLDRGRNYGLFSDFEADLNTNRLIGYSRKLTGVKLHIEQKNGDFVTATGAKPDTSFARQIISGGNLNFVRLDYSEILDGSEVLVLEVRDRRNPEIILQRDSLTRGIDYNIDSYGGSITFLRPISAFDYQLNLIQVVATYEYRSNGISSGVYTLRAGKTIEKLGLKLGFSMVDQRQKDESPFRLIGGDFSFKLPNRGTLEGEFGMSRGFFNNGQTSTNDNPNHIGSAFFVSLNQPLPKFFQSTLKAELSSATENFFNPFGSTITPGSSRAAASLELKPLNKSVVKLNLIGELNSTANVDNKRVTAGLQWTQLINNKIRLNFGYDFRKYSDNLVGTTINSNLLTIGIEWKPTERLNLSVKREQNLTNSDPTFPNQTTFSANYRLNDSSKIFFTQRLASAEISPIADVGGSGFSSTKARRETAFGIESKLNKYSNLTGRYQLENGLNSKESFAVIGVNNRLPINKQFAIDFGYERGFNIAGSSKGFNNLNFGTSWTPNDSFRASTRYSLRDRDGFGQSFSIVSAGILKKGWTTLARFQYGSVAVKDRSAKIADGQISVAIRPQDTDKYGFLFSYNYRNSNISNKLNEAPTRLRTDTLSTDGYYQPNSRVEFYLRSALRLNGDGNQALPYAATLTYLLQGRVQYRVSNSIDFGGEFRSLFQPSSKSVKTNYAIETGYWLNSDIRLGIGYNLKRTKDFNNFENNKGGTYFTISTKISNLFNLFGTPKKPHNLPAENDTESSQIGSLRNK